MIAIIFSPVIGWPIIYIIGLKINHALPWNIYRIGNLLFYIFPVFILYFPS